MLVDNFYFNTALILFISYLVGSIPTAYIAGRIKGVDITQEGNKNVGASNTFFFLGKTLGILVLIIDVAKGYLAAWMATILTDSHPFIPMLAVVAVIAGHNWMMFIKFKGGKGTAALLGALIFLEPLSIPVLFIALIPLASILLKDTYLGQGVAMFCFAFIMWGWKVDYYWCVFMLLVTMIYSLRCLFLYKTYFTEKRRYINPIVKIIFRKFLKDV